MVITLLAACAACEQLSTSNSRRSTKLSETEFVDVCVKLARATSPAEKTRIMKEAGVTREDLDQFIAVYLEDLPGLSQVFDSVVARMGNPVDGPLPVLPTQ